MKALSILLLLLISACQTENKSTDNETIVTFTIASYQKDCQGEQKQKCLLVKENNETEWSFFYSNIEGFTYEEGYEYVLKVKKENIQNPPQDASSIKYIMLELVSKTKANT